MMSFNRFKYFKTFFNIDNDSHLFQRLWWWCWWWWWKYGRKILYGRFSLPSSQIFQRVNLENFPSPSFSTSPQTCLYFCEKYRFSLFHILFLFSLNFLHYLIYVFFVPSFSEMKVFFFFKSDHTGGDRLVLWMTERWRCAGSNRQIYTLSNERKDRKRWSLCNLISMLDLNLGEKWKFQRRNKVHCGAAGRWLRGSKNRC